MLSPRADKLPVFNEDTTLPMENIARFGRKSRRSLQNLRVSLLLHAREKNKMIRLFGLKNCDTCRKALKKLKGATLVDVWADGMPANLLTSAFEQFGENLVNSRSKT